MKKLIARICIWTLDRLGYDNVYSDPYTIEIKVDAKEAVKSLNHLIYKMEQMKKALPNLFNK